MIPPSRKQARKTFPARFRGLVAASVIALQLAAVFSVEAKSGPEILAEAREMIRAQDVSLTGKLRTGPRNVPFSLTQRGGVSTYVFRDPTETITVSLGDLGVRITGAESTATPIRNSVLTYDDLALRFLYWTRIEEQGTEKLRSLPCWKLRLDAPDQASPYAFVKLWVNQQSGAFLQAQAFDWNGVLTKQFDVVSTQKVGGRYFLKSMKIQRLGAVPKGSETLSYLEIDRPE